MLTHVAASLVISVGIITSSLASTIDPSPPTANLDTAEVPLPPVVTPVASGDGVAVTVTQDGSTSSGRSFESTATVRVTPACWYGRGPTGAVYFETWRPGGLVENGTWSPSADQYVDPTLHANYEHYATVEGHWFEATCRADAPREYRLAYYASHPGLFVEPADPEPAPEVGIDPAVLAQTARDAMDLPRGVIRWNPSLAGSGATVVGADTWVWLDDAATTVRVRAEIPGTWAQVDAVLTGLDVTAAGADPVHCPDTGTPWTAAATGTTCAIRFIRSSANQSVKDGQTVPTVTLTATATWAASWTSSQTITATDLDTPLVATSAEVPVAELQALVTRG